MDDTRSPRPGQYIDAGIRTYYETRGTGEPVVLLHGGVAPAETFDPQAIALSERFRVLLPERRGHGRTPDVPGPITYAQMAEDTIAFMDALEVRNARVVGWSDGAVVAMHVLLRRPDLVDRLVLMGQALHPDGLSETVIAMSADLGPDHVPPMLRRLYEAVSPDGPEHFEVVFAKLAAIWKVPPAFEPSELDRVTVPTLLLLGDDDPFITLEHAVSLRRAMPNAQLAVVPGGSHAVHMEQPEVVNAILGRFLG